MLEYDKNLLTIDNTPPPSRYCVTTLYCSATEALTPRSRLQHLLWNAADMRPASTVAAVITLLRRYMIHLNAAAADLTSESQIILLTLCNCQLMMCYKDIDGHFVSGVSSEMYVSRLTCISSIRRCL